MGTRGAGGQIGSDAIRPRDRDVHHGHDRAEEIGGGLVGWLARHRIEQPDIRRQWKRDAHESVVDQIGEVAGVLPVHAEVVGIHRPEKRIVRVLVEFAFRQQCLEPGARGGRRELKAVPTAYDSRRTRVRCRQVP